VGTGPYLVLPFFGPSSVRDGLGLAVDSQASLINQVSSIPERNTLYVTRVVDVRAKLLNLTDQVDQVALDKYSFARDAYLQKRLNDVYDGDPPQTQDPSEQTDQESPAKTKP
jgi:phospholipid-binding lipoprotein MlaA